MFGTVLDDGEDAGSDRALEAAGAALTVVFHAMYEGNPESVDGLPGGVEWRKQLEAVPERERHLATHADHLVRVTERDRPLGRESGLAGDMWMSVPSLRVRAAGLIPPANPVDMTRGGGIAAAASLWVSRRLARPRSPQLDAFRKPEVSSTGSSDSQSYRPLHITSFLSP